MIHERQSLVPKRTVPKRPADLEFQGKKHRPLFEKKKRANAKNFHRFLISQAQEDFMKKIPGPGFFTRSLHGKAFS